MDLEQLKYYIALSKKLNFTKVAEQYFTTQPTVCRRISALEDEVGTKLVNRSTHGITLTRAGQEFVRYATEIVNIFETATRSLKDSDQPPAKVLKFASFSSSEDILMSCTTSFTKRHPDIQIIVDTFSGRNMLEALDDTQYSFFFLHTKYVEGRVGFQYIHTKREKSFFVVRPSDAGKVKDGDFSALGGLPFVCTSATEGVVLYQLFMRTCSVMGIVPHIVNFYAKAASALLGVKMGIGNTILPASIVKGASGVSLFPINDEVAYLDSCVAWRSCVNSPEIDLFKLHLINMFTTPEAKPTV